MFAEAYIAAKSAEDAHKKRQETTKLLLLNLINKARREGLFDIALFLEDERAYAEGEIPEEQLFLSALSVLREHSIIFDVRLGERVSILRLPPPEREWLLRVWTDPTVTAREVVLDVSVPSVFETWQKTQNVLLNYLGELTQQEKEAEQP